MSVYVLLLPLLVVVSDWMNLGSQDVARVVVEVCRRLRFLEAVACNQK